MARRAPIPAVAAPLFPVGVAVAVTLALAGCGSQLSPAEVAAANGSAVTVTSSTVGSVGSEVSADGGGAVPAGAVDQGTGAGAAADGGEGAGAAPGTSSGATGAGGGAGAADSGVKAGNCAGFANQTGITDSTITLANVADISGPVPGLFQAAQDAVTAFVAYFDATVPRGICGRSLTALALDTREDAGGDQTAYARACDEAFAVVGSASAFDSGGVATAEKCGIPDIRSNSLTDERNACSVCFPTQAGASNVSADAGYAFYRRTERAATDRAAFLYIDVGGAAAQSDYIRRTAESVGFDTVYTAGIDIMAFNYGPYAQKLKDTGAEFVNFIAANDQAVRLAQAMAQIDYRPVIYDVTQEQYAPSYASAGGSSVDGTSVVLPHPLFSAAAAGSEAALYVAWLRQVKPSATPSTTGLFAWSAARLFVQQAVRLGGRLTRATMLAAVRDTHSWTANGLHAAYDVGAKLPAKCVIVARLDGATWRQISPRGYTCGGIARF